MYLFCNDCFIASISYLLSFRHYNGIVCFMESHLQIFKYNVVYPFNHNDILDYCGWGLLFLMDIFVLFKILNDDVGLKHMIFVFMEESKNINRNSLVFLPPSDRKFRQHDR